MGNQKFYEAWEKRVETLKGELLKRDTLLRQYAIWLETSEENTLHKGGDVYNMLVGVLQGLSDVDFIPGIGWQNFVAVVGEVQKETGLSLGVCQYLSDNIRENYKAMYLGEKTEKTLPECKAKSGLLIGSLNVCLPPQRCKCEYRADKLEKMAVEED